MDPRGRVGDRRWVAGDGDGVDGRGGWGRGTPPAFQTIVAWGCYSEGSECYFLPHFNPDTNANMNLVGYEYKMDSSNSDSNPDTFSI